MALTEPQKLEILESLNVEQEDFIKASKLRNRANGRAVKKYGKDALKLILEEKIAISCKVYSFSAPQIFELDSTIANNPWNFIVGKSINEAIDLIWGNNFKQFTDSLKQHCEAIFALKIAEEWFLIYAYEHVGFDGILYYDCLIGQSPNKNAVLSNELINKGWKMPSDLSNFYEIHNGFGYDIIGKDSCIFSNEELKTKLDFLQEIAENEKWDIDYNFHDLLPFYGDGMGNSQNFLKNKSCGNSYLTADWDHETRGLSDGEPFTEFFEERFCSMLEWQGIPEVESDPKENEIKIISGPFKGSPVIELIKVENDRYTLMISVFGKNMEHEFGVDEIEKNE